jgi:hypothetical protein
MLGPIERLPLVGGVIKKAIPESFRFEREIKAIAPISAPGEEVEGIHIRDNEAAAAEALGWKDMIKEYLPDWKKDDDDKLVYPYITFGSGKSEDEEKAEKARKKFEDKQKKMREAEGDAYSDVMLNSTAFRGEGAVHVNPGDTDVSEALIRKDARKKLYQEKKEKELKRKTTLAPTENKDEEEEEDEEQVDTHPLLAGVSPNAYVYRLSSVYDRFPDAKVGRIRMNVPTVRGRKKVAPEDGDKDKASQSYRHVNNFDAQVTCRDIPGLNWYVPNTKLQVPSKNMAFKYSAMYSQLLKGATKRSIMGFVLTRSIQVISIYGVAAAGAAQAAGKAAMEGAMDKVKSAAKAEVDGAVKEAKKEIKAEAGEAKKEIKDAAAEGAKDAVGGEETKRMLAEVDDVIHVATGVGLFGTGGFIGAGAIGGRMLSAVEGAADVRFLAAAAEKAVKHASKKEAKGLWSFFFPTGGLSQAAVLMIAQGLNFCVATKGVYDDSEGEMGKFWRA